jgi:hypothetical protein
MRPIVRLARGKPPIIDKARQTELDSQRRRLLLIGVDTVAEAFANHDKPNDQ